MFEWCNKFLNIFREGLARRPIAATLQIFTRQRHEGLCDRFGRVWVHAGKIFVFVYVDSNKVYVTSEYDFQKPFCDLDTFLSNG